MNEEWSRWNPCDIPEGEFVVTRLSQDIDGVRVVLDDEIFEIEIFFDGFPPIVFSSMEGLRMRTCREVLSKYGNDRFFRENFFFKVSNSKLEEWAIAESCGFYDKDSLQHYCIVTCVEVIDIIAGSDPIVSIKRIKGDC